MNGNLWTTEAWWISKDGHALTRLFVFLFIFVMDCDVVSPILIEECSKSGVGGSLETNLRDGNPLPIAIDRMLRTKCHRMLQFIKAHEDSLSSEIVQLREFACTPGGLVLDEIRSIVWPILASSLLKDNLTEEQHEDEETAGSESDFESALSMFTLDEGGGKENDENSSDCSNILSVIGGPSLDDLKSHKQWNQVELDVQRTLARFPPNISDEHRHDLQMELTPLIVRILWDSPRFNYYQGFHDVCLTLLLAVGAEKAEKIAHLLAKSGIFNRYLLHSLEDTVLRDLDMMYVILWKNDPELENRMRSLEVGSLFALSWPLTWFSHSFHHYHQIVLCFDLFFSTHPLMPVYLTSAVVLWRSSSVLSVSQDMPTVHHLLNIVPDELPVYALIADAQDLFRLLPPSLVRKKFMDDYRKVLQSKGTRRSTLPVTSLRAWLIAGTATAAIYMLSKYLFNPS
ncbi:hypothetical protein AB6A40_002608 [Gnathostoma spinigerum]|uniref:Rab-GAP TBC domain-containing protein n=1 Tax=Gnathostoma spinigerum TaxID=75299 RepID=A0ABD6E724_9BILA